MPVHNADIAAVFEEIADLLEIQGANPFRIRAYRNGARTLEGLGHDARTLVEDGEDLTQLPGIGKDLAAKIEEIVTTGHCKSLEKLRKEFKGAPTELLNIGGLGPKKVKILYQELGISSVEQLRNAARDQQIRGLPGFGEKTEEKILAAIEAKKEAKTAFMLPVAMQYAESLVKYLKGVKGVKQVAVAGSYRRRKETVGDLDILVTVGRSSQVMDRFVGYDEVREVVSRGDTRSTVILHSGLQVDLRVVDDECYGAALYYFTGSKAHNIAVRKLGQKRGLKINEYGVFKGDKRIAGKTEESVFKTVDLHYIPPEMREDRGEIQAAQKGRLPELVTLADLKGDLHAHTKATDGRNTLEEMARAAKDLGFQYLAITEHSRRLTVARGMDHRRLLEHMEAIDHLNSKLKGFTVLKGIEVDILEDGSLDLPDEVLAELDLVVGAVHSKFNLSEAKQTERILRAMDRPHFSILAHPSGRLIPNRQPYEVDMEKVIAKARQRGCFLELNAQPERLDLSDTYCQMAKDQGVLVSINSDAHSIRDFDKLDFGIGQARRGWLEKKDVLNTRPLAELRKLLKKTM